MRLAPGTFSFPIIKEDLQALAVRGRLEGGRREELCRCSDTGTGLKLLCAGTERICIMKYGLF